MTTKKIIETVQKQIQNFDKDKYYLAPNHGLRTLISLIQLKDDNFDDWTNVIKLALESKNKLSFIDGTTPQPDENNSKFKK